MEEAIFPCEKSKNEQSYNKDDNEETYKPFPRPQPTTSYIKTFADDAITTEKLKLCKTSTENIRENQIPNYSSCSSSSIDSDSDNSTEKISKNPKSKKKRKESFIDKVSENIVNTPEGDCGEKFKNAFDAYQINIIPESGEISTQSGNIKKDKPSVAKNVWGSVLREDALTNELTSIVVGSKNAKAMNSDRGAEAYDYTVAADYHNKTRKLEDKSTRKKSKFHKLDDDLDAYWKQKSELDTEKSMETTEERKNNAICGGHKRRAKQSHETKKKYGPKDTIHNQANISKEDILKPGVPNMLADLPEAFVISLTKINQAKGLAISSNAGKNTIEEIMKSEVEKNESSVNSPFPNSFALGKQLAEILSEPKRELVIGVLDLVGGQIALELFSKTKSIEAAGGMMIKNGDRRRTPGGVFLHLLRELSNDPRVDPKKIKQFFSQSQKINTQNERKPFFRNDAKSQKRGYQNDSHKYQYKNNHKKYKWQNPCAKDDSFQNELQALQKLSQKAKEKKNEKEKKAASNVKDKDAGSNIEAMND
jgi:hypothetical protein